MTTNLVERVNALNDFHAVKFLEHFSERLLDGIQSDVDQIMMNIPTSITAIPEYDVVKNLALGEIDIELTEAESISFSRQCLVKFAQNSDVAPLLEKALDSYPLLAGGAVTRMLSAGLTASMVVLVATSEVTFKVGDDITIYKPTAGPELVIPLVKALAALANKPSSDSASKKQK